jgi:glucosyltransferase
MIPGGNSLLKKISVVIPCFNEETALPFFYEAITSISGEMSFVEFEYLFIDDGSTDETLALLRELALKDNRIRFVSFSRNFGKEAAMFAGMEHSTGDYVVIMDVDLQDPPDLIPQMYEAVVKEGYDCAGTRRVNRKGEPPIRSFFARRFYRLINRISKTQMLDGVRDYRMMTRKMVNAILSMCEYNRFSKGIFGWVGFRTKWLEYENVERVAGETKWSFWKLFIYSLDGILAFSTMPLAIASVVGIILFILSIVMIIFIIIRTLIWGDPVAGWPAMACIIFLVGGIQLLCLGIAGQYIAKSYLEVKKRPIYISKETEKDLSE